MCRDWSVEPLGPEDVNPLGGQGCLFEKMRASLRLTWIFPSAVTFSFLGHVVMFSQNMEEIFLLQSVIVACFN